MRRRRHLPLPWYVPAALLMSATVAPDVAAQRAGTAPAMRVDRLIVGGRLLDGAGGDWVWADVGITGDKISFVGHAFDAKVTAKDTIDAKGLLVTPGLWDVHNHERLEKAPESSPSPSLHKASRPSSSASMVSATTKSPRPSRRGGAVALRSTRSPSWDTARRVRR